MLFRALVPILALAAFVAARPLDLNAGPLIDGSSSTSEDERHHPHHPHHHNGTQPSNPASPCGTFSSIIPLPSPIGIEGRWRGGPSFSALPPSCTAIGGDPSGVPSLPPSDIPSSVPAPSSSPPSSGFSSDPIPSPTDLPLPWSSDIPSLPGSSSSIPASGILSDPVAAPSGIISSDVRR